MSNSNLVQMFQISLGLPEGIRKFKNSEEVVSALRDAQMTISTKDKALAMEVCVLIMGRLVYFRFKAPPTDLLNRLQKFRSNPDEAVRTYKSSRHVPRGNLEDIASGKELRQAKQVVALRLAAVALLVAAIATLFWPGGFEFFAVLIMLAGASFLLSWKLGAKLTEDYEFWP